MKISFSSIQNYLDHCEIASKIVWKNRKKSKKIKFCILKTIKISVFKISPKNLDPNIRTLKEYVKFRNCMRIMIFRLTL